MAAPREEAARWFARMQNVSEDDYGERSRFERWLAQSPANSQAYQSIAQLWDDLGRTQPLSRLAAASQATAARRSLSRRSAAGMVAGAAAGVLGWHYGARDGVPDMAWSTSPGENRSEQLPDGSRILMAGATQLLVRLAAGYRQVTLVRGMAAFEVAHDLARPFSVHSRNVLVTGDGTHFGVHRFDDRVRVSVLEGRVRVVRQQSWLWGLRAHEAQSWMLPAGQVLDVATDGGALQPRQPRDELAWRDGALVFRNADLAEVAEALSRYSAVPVRVDGAAGLAGIRIAAVAQTAQVEGFLRALPRIAPVRVEHRGDALWLRAAAR